MTKTSNDRQKQWRKNNPEKYAKQKERWKLNRKLKFPKGLPVYHKRKESETDLEFIKRTWSRRKATANSKNKYFTINFTDIEWVEFCPITGYKIDYSGKDYEKSWSLDRLNSNLGYIPGNVFILSRRANRIKNDGTLEEHKKIVEWMQNKLKDS